MMWSRKLAAAAAMAVVLVPGGAAAEPRNPTDNWVVNFDAAQCVAYRAYGTEQKPLTLMLKAPPAGEVLQLFVMRNGAAMESAEQLDGRVRSGSGPEQRLSVLAYSPPKSGRRVFRYNLPKAEVAAWAASPVLEVRASPGLRESFALSGLKPVLKVLDECVADLRTEWNYTDEGAVSKNLQRVQGDLTGLINSDDYPAVNIRKGEAGSVQVVVLVDAAGKVADCSLVESSGVAALDAQTCATIKERATFKPAVGADGRPAKDIFFQRVTWRF